VGGEGGRAEGRPPGAEDSTHVPCRIVLIGGQGHGPSIAHGVVYYFRARWGRGERGGRRTAEKGEGRREEPPGAAIAPDIRGSGSIVLG